MTTPIRFYVTEQLSEHIAETPEGYLLCTDVPITRIGEFLYKGKELLGQDGAPLVRANDDGYVRIQRDEADVFSEITLKSFEGKPFTLDHPDGFVTPENWNSLAHGHIQNVRRGTGEQSDLALCDIMVTTEKAISLIKAGERELSCGYDAEYEELDKGMGKQHSIIGNHVALVSRGRAGNRCAIQDKSADDERERNHCQEVVMKKKTFKDAIMQFFDRLPSQIRDAEVEETEEEKAERLEKEAAEKAEKEKEKKEAEDKKTKDESGDKLTDFEARLTRIEELLSELLALEEEDEKETTDEEVEKKEEEEKEKEKDEKETADEEAEKEKEKDEKEEKETTDAWPDVLPVIEVLTPGVKLETPKKKATLDSYKAEAILGAMKDKDYGTQVASLLGKNDVRKMTSDALDVAFTSAATVVSMARSRSLVRNPVIPNLTKDSSSVTIRKINEANKRLREGK